MLGHVIYPSVEGTRVLTRKKLKYSLWTKHVDVIKCVERYEACQKKDTKLACYRGNIWDRYTRKIPSPFGSAVKPHTARAQLYCSRTSGNEFGRLSNPTFGRLYTCCHPHPRGNTCHQVSAIPPRLVVAGDPTFGSHGQTGAPSLRSSLPSTNFGPLKLERLNRRSESSSIIINHRDPPEESHASSLFPPEFFHLLRRTHHQTETTRTKSRPKKKEIN
ncbi:hypothetical protein YC2023_004938 [Brassica napus]